MKHSIPLPEPLWGKHLMVWLNEWINKHYILTKLVPFTADIFVFTYPVYLVALYLIGITKRKEYFKDAAMYIFFSSAIAAGVNIVVKFFVDKQRPEEYITNKNNLILDHLPTAPFPSDHAAVAAAVAMSTMIWWIRHKDKTFVRLSWFFWLACLVMSVSRVAVAIHWPTDVLVGIGVGILSAWILLRKRIWAWVKRTILTPLIALEKWIFKKVFQIDQ